MHFTHLPCIDILIYITVTVIFPLQFNLYSHILMQHLHFNVFLLYCKYIIQIITMYNDFIFYYLYCYFTFKYSSVIISLLNLCMCNHWFYCYILYLSLQNLNQQLYLISQPVSLKLEKRVKQYFHYNVKNIFNYIVYTQLCTHFFNEGIIIMYKL